MSSFLRNIANDGKAKKNIKWDKIIYSLGFLSYAYKLFNEYVIIQKDWIVGIGSLIFLLSSFVYIQDAITTKNTEMIYLTYAKNIIGFIIVILLFINACGFHFVIIK